MRKLLSTTKVWQSWVNYRVQHSRAIRTSFVRKSCLRNGSGHLPDLFLCQCGFFPCINTKALRWASHCYVQGIEFRICRPVRCAVCEIATCERTQIYGFFGFRIYSLCDYWQALLVRRLPVGAPSSYVPLWWICSNDSSSGLIICAEAECSRPVEGYSAP